MSLWQCRDDALRYAGVDLFSCPQLRVITYDSSVPTQRDTADVTITVARNLNAPVFTRSNYVVTVDEEYPLGRAVVNATAADADPGVSVNTQVSASPRV